MSCMARLSGLPGLLQGVRLGALSLATAALLLGDLDLGGALPAGALPAVDLFWG